MDAGSLDQAQGRQVRHDEDGGVSPNWRPPVPFRIRRRRRGAEAERPQSLVEQHHGVFEGHALAAAAGLEAALGAARLAVPAGEELHDAVEFGVGVGRSAAMGTCAPPLHTPSTMLRMVPLPVPGRI